jgi:hypothetical protein
MLFDVLFKILYTGEDKKNLHSLIDSNTNLGTVFTEYYPLISLLTDLIDIDEIKNEVRKIISILNTYNGNLLLYYHIFSPDKLLKIPKFNYYELPQVGNSGSFLYFNDDKNIDLNNFETVPAITPESTFLENSNSVVLNNFGRIKKRDSFKRTKKNERSNQIRLIAKVLRGRIKKQYCQLKFAHFGCSS